MEEACGDPRPPRISFHPDRLVDLRRIGDGIPAVSQVEPHAFHQQRAARRYMEKYGIRHER